MGVPDSSAAQNMLAHGAGPGQDDLAGGAVLPAAAGEAVDLVGGLQKIDDSDAPLLNRPRRPRQI